MADVPGQRRYSSEEIERLRRRVVNAGIHPVDMDEIRRQARAIVDRGGRPPAVGQATDDLPEITSYRIWLLAREIARMAGLPVAPDPNDPTESPALHAKHDGEPAPE